MNQVIHLESSVILGEFVNFSDMPNKIKTLFYDYVFPIAKKHNAQLMFYKELCTNHYGCIDMNNGVVLE